MIHAHGGLNSRLDSREAHHTGAQEGERRGVSRVTTTLVNGLEFHFDLDGRLFSDLVMVGSVGLLALPRARCRVHG